MHLARRGEERHSALDYRRTKTLLEISGRPEAVERLMKKANAAAVLLVGGLRVDRRECAPSPFAKGMAGGH